MKQMQQTASVELAFGRFPNQYQVLVDGMPSGFYVQPSDYHDDYLHLPKGWDVIYPDLRWAGPFPSRYDAALTAEKLYHKERLASLRLAYLSGAAA